MTSFFSVHGCRLEQGWLELLPVYRVQKRNLIGSTSLQLNKRDLSAWQLTAGWMAKDSELYCELANTRYLGFHHGCPIL